MRLGDLLDRQIGVAIFFAPQPEQAVHHDDAGRDGIDRHSNALQRTGQADGEIVQRGLRAGIVRTQIIGLDGHGTRDIDDPSQFGGDHVRHGEPAQSHRCQRVCMVIRDPIGRADLNRRLRGVSRRAAARIVDEDLDVSAERGPRLGMDGGSAFVRRQVSDGDPRSLDVSRDLLGPFAVSAMDNHRAALLGEHAGDALSDPAAAACDERAPALELKIHNVLPPRGPRLCPRRSGGRAQAAS